MNLLQVACQNILSANSVLKGLSSIVGTLMMLLICFLYSMLTFSQTEFHFLMLKKFLYSISKEDMCDLSKTAIDHTGCGCCSYELMNLGPFVGVEIVSWAWH